ncbi:anthranilate synthase component II [Leeuwenhoekiella parthenopeia]|uniref:Aminodeoxychorismate/anthranilate synthase component II n=1 Tax=Leeuwenhoekiella parthenopeia TaxID=2890320 RepID=A0ABS8GX03_9FLAO|nr:aminodeoxychorismate/anthranilate synthase component II [Leeuwenhoekiella parthenopeia]MCC4214331.1 aminodeoxychorismate/anthranilate synthase component II [Leeuwenhoekiella parthenopeia]
METNSNSNNNSKSTPLSGVGGLKILVIDNYDSFVYNLVHYLEDLDCEVTVKRNDQLTLEEVKDYDKILLSPGPGIPDEAGLLKAIIKEYAPTKSMFGVCLGQQAIGEVFGGSLINLDKVFHGVATKAKQTVKDETLFKDIPEEFEIGRYHSWVVAPEGFPEELEITSVDDNGQIMSLRHKTYDVRGVQFHPESVLTPEGKKMIKNWINA